MTDKISERKKYSIHNLVKLIHQRKKEAENKELGNPIEEESQKKKGKEKEQHNVKLIKVDRNKKREGTNPIQKNITNGPDVIETEECEESSVSESVEVKEYSEEEIILTNDSKEVPCIPLFMIDYKDCHNKKCSCKKMYYFKSIQKITKQKKFKGIVLTPFCDKYFSKEDKTIAETHGLCVVDCSWKSEHILKKSKFLNPRKVPYTIAVNSINFGKPYKLSCLEAIVACLYICNYTSQCDQLTRLYKWSQHFIPINKQVLDKYQLCDTHEDIEKMQEEIIENYEKEKEEHKKIDEYKIIYEESYISEEDEKEDEKP